MLRGGTAPEQQDQLQQASRTEASNGGSPRRQSGERSPKRSKFYGRDGTTALSQLSDIAKEISKAPVTAVTSQFHPPSQPPFSQDSLIVAPLQYQPPSQPDIPPPILPDSQAASNPADDPTQPNIMQEQEAQAHARPSQVAPPALLPFSAADFMAHQPMMLATAEFMAHPGAAFAMQMSPEDLQQHLPREKGSKPTRRGPMDEMRQLVRILVKILPQSIGFIGSGEEAGGGNRISEEQIKFYLEKTLGQAPRPTWGVPGGWQQYVSQLFGWALGRPVSEDEAKRCAKREPGRSWEALEVEMNALGVHPNSWPLPLTLEGVQAAEKNPVPQPVPQIVVKRATDESGQPVSKRQKGSGGFPDLTKLGEQDLWAHMLQVLGECTAKQGKAQDQGAVMALKMEAKQRMDALLGGAGGGLNMFQYVPVAMGLDGGQSVMALLGGMGGMQGGMMALPQVGGPQFGLPQPQPGAPGMSSAELTLGGQDVDQANAAAVQLAAANMAAAAAIAAQQAQHAAGMDGKRRERDDGTPDMIMGHPLVSQPDAAPPMVTAAPAHDDADRHVSAEAAFAAAAAAMGGDRSKMAPLSSQEARGTLLGALGGGMAGAGAMLDPQQAQQHHQVAAQQVQQQLGEAPQS